MHFFFVLGGVLCSLYLPSSVSPGPHGGPVLAECTAWESLEVSLVGLEGPRSERSVP